MLNPDFSAFVRSLDAEAVRYLVVDGYAVVFHGHPRYTKDFDVWVDATADNAVRLVAALDACGFGALGLRPEDFVEPDTVIQLGYPPARIDILTSIPGVTFGDCHARRVVAVVDGLAVPFIDLDDLIVNKRAAGRHQDLADVDALSGGASAQDEP